MVKASRNYLIALMSLLSLRGSVGCTEGGLKRKECISSDNIELIKEFESIWQK
jgi:hypothetical protein